MRHLAWLSPFLFALTVSACSDHPDEVVLDARSVPPVADASPPVDAAPTPDASADAMADAQPADAAVSDAQVSDARVNDAAP